ncbi:hypothetical protein [Sporosarcina sp. SAFN-015]|uniref:hypothetical protein n=1 Tax=Sporosarcina sp. SAFN-015 TaxID=3387274 RepID=UPI003F7F4597
MVRRYLSNSTIGNTTENSTGNTADNTTGFSGSSFINVVILIVLLLLVIFGSTDISKLTGAP